MKKLISVILTIAALFTASAFAGNPSRWREPHGRVSVIERWRDGYRVWVAGSRIPFYVHTRYSDFERRDQLKFVHAKLRGKVESVDAEKGRFVIYNEPTEGSIIVDFGDGPLGSLRVGDEVELTGRWQRLGTFAADRIEFIRE
ncbi:MAG TPA: hypothetical protein VNA69_10700 [Thermoanaerobaculia bacterium]|nr:hypothetical protein [Thermoanaerobaculia bacterium]